MTKQEKLEVRKIECLFAVSFQVEQYRKENFGELPTN